MFSNKVMGIFIGTLSAPIINILIVFLVARYIDHEEYGQYILVITLIQAIGFILFSGLGNSMNRFINDIDPPKFLKYYGYSYTVLLGLLVITSIFVLNTVYVGRYSMDIQLIIIVMAFLIPTINFEISVLNFRMNYLAFGLFKLLYASMFLLLPIVIYMVLDSGDYTILLYSSFVGLLLVLLPLLKKRHTVFSNFNLNKSNFYKDIVKYSVIVTGASIASWAISFSDRIMIESMIDASTLTIYALNAKIAGVVGIVVSLVSIYFQAGKDLLFFVLEKLYNETSFWLVFILLIANSLLIFINYSSVFLSLLDKIYINTYAYGLGAVLNVLINIFLLEKYDVLVAAISTLVAYSIILLVINSYLLFNFKSIRLQQEDL